MKKRYYDIFYRDIYGLENILSLLAQLNNVSVDELKSKSRKRQLSDIRQAYMIIADRKKTATRTLIAEVINRGHANVNYALQNQQIKAIKQIIQQYDNAGINTEN